MQPQVERLFLCEIQRCPERLSQIVTEATCSSWHMHTQSASGELRYATSEEWRAAEGASPQWSCEGSRGIPHRSGGRCSRRCAASVVRRESQAGEGRSKSS